VLEECLPANLRGPATTITRIAAGLSGAGVFRVEAGGEIFVLKVSAADDEPFAGWRARVHIQEVAASAGVAPRVIHVDESRRAVTSAFVVDRGFVPLVFDPRTRDAAIAQLGRTLRQVHDLPIPADAAAGDLRGFLAAASHVSVPDFVAAAIRRMVAEEPPPSTRTLVLSHNDVNPTNLVYDGETLMLLDWAMAGPNDPLYDLAAIAVFLRMDDDTCRKLLGAHDGAPVDELPARFHYNKRLIAVLCGTVFLRLARDSGYTGGIDDTLEAAPSLGDVFQRRRAGSLDVGSADGQWAFGLALVKASVDFSS
jgi:aminoglycoside phosphotransferase